MAAIANFWARTSPRERLMLGGLGGTVVAFVLFVLNALLPRVGLGNIFRGCWPFVLVMVLMLGVLIAFPQLSLWLPSMMK